MVGPGLSQKPRLCVLCFISFSILQESSRLKRLKSPAVTKQKCDTRLDKVHNLQQFLFLGWLRHQSGHRAFRSIDGHVMGVPLSGEFNCATPSSLLFSVPPGPDGLVLSSTTDHFTIWAPVDRVHFVLMARQI